MHPDTPRKWKLRVARGRGGYRSRRSCDLRRQPWVGAAIAKIAKGDTFSAAWKNPIPTPDTYEEVLASAQVAHAAGALFKNVKGRQPPEFAPEPEEAEVDDFDAGDGESQADDQGLRS